MILLKFICYIMAKYVYISDIKFLWCFIVYYWDQPAFFFWDFKVSA